MRARIAAVLFGLAILTGAGRASADTSIIDVQLGIVPINTPVQCDGVVVTAVGFFGFFVQEPNLDGTWGRQYSGIWVFTNHNHSVHKGDMVNVGGRYEEFNNFSEINMTVGGSVSVTGTATIPAPVNVLISEVNDTGAFAEPYESVFVRVDRNDATLFARPANGFNEWYLGTTSVPLTGDSLLVDTYSSQSGDDFEYSIPDPGAALTFAQGILVYNFSQYKLAPRNCETDLGTPCKPVLRGAYSTGSSTVNVQFGVGVDEPTAENINNYELASGFAVLTAQRDDANHRIIHLTTDVLPNGDPEQIIINNVASEGGLVMNPNQTSNFRSGITPIQQIQFVTAPGTNDASPLVNEVVTVEGRITAIDGNYNYIQDADGGQWDGIYARVAKTGGTTAIGDKLQVTGVVSEFFGATQVGFIAGRENWVNQGPVGGVVTNTVTAAQIKYRDALRTAEPWEYNLVKIANATMDSLAGVAGPVFGEWLCKQLPDTAACDLNGITGVSYDPCIGDRADITGILRYGFGQYRIAPRTGRGGDINVIFDNPTCAATGVGDGWHNTVQILPQNRPNPFVGSTEIRLQLPAGGKAQLDVLDVGGRVLARIVDANLEAGGHAFTWDGTNSEGHPVSAGTYFARLRVGERELSRKMMIVK